MRVGIVGAGFMGRTHARAWAAAGESVVATVAMDDGSADAMAAEHSLRVYPTTEALAHEVDCVDVCLPTHLHLSAVEQAAPHVGGSKTGSIFCEKPLARTVADAERLVALCDEHSVRLGVGHVVRFFPDYAHALALVEAGTVGTPAVLRFSRRAFAPCNRWFLDREQSGGVIFDLMIHDIDFARLAAGPIVRVFGSLDAPEQAGEHAHAICTHASGAITHLEASWRYPHGEFHADFEIAGSGGLISSPGGGAAPIVPYLYPNSREGSAGSDEQAVPVAVQPSPDDPYVRELRAFARAVNENQEPPVAGRDGLAAVRVAAAIEHSIASGQAVDLPREAQS